MLGDIKDFLIFGWKARAKNSDSWNSGAVLLDTGEGFTFAQFIPWLSGNNTTIFHSLDVRASKQVFENDVGQVDMGDSETKVSLVDLEIPPFVTADLNEGLPKQLKNVIDVR